jgi:mono/diheme cytochrome c family protein
MMRVFRSTAAIVATLALAAALLISVAAAKPKAKPHAKAKPDTAIAQGKKVYEKAQCGMCHGIAGKGGRIDLTHVGKARKAPWLKTQVRDPKKNDPGSGMPAYDAKRVNEKDLLVLVSYLVSLK